MKSRTTKMNDKKNTVNITWAITCSCTCQKWNHNVKNETTMSKLIKTLSKIINKSTKVNFHFVKIHAQHDMLHSACINESEVFDLDHSWLPWRQILSPKFSTNDKFCHQKISTPKLRHQNCDTKKFRHQNFDTKNFDTKKLRHLVNFNFQK